MSLRTIRTIKVLAAVAAYACGWQFFVAGNYAIASSMFVFSTIALAKK